MVKIFDDSINPNTPVHRERSHGPLQNDIMVGLHKYASNFDFEFVKTWKKADVVITNTTYTDAIEKSSIRKVKRMDGIFWRVDEVPRNTALNRAAMLSDKVIFISEYSKRTFHELYPLYNLKSESIVLNNVDNSIFHPMDDFHPSPFKFTWIAGCTNWDREEKRFDDLMRFAEIAQYDMIYLIGKCNFDTPDNVHIMGYLSDYKELTQYINLSDAFVNVSFRDAGCKMACQAVNCDKPVLYANSGGLPEIVKDGGIPIKDNTDINIGNFSPSLEIYDIEHAYGQFKMTYNDLKHRIKISSYQETMKQYFDAIKEIL